MFAVNWAVDGKNRIHGGLCLPPVGVRVGSDRRAGRNLRAEFKKLPSFLSMGIAQVLTDNW